MNEQQIAGFLYYFTDADLIRISNQIRNKRNSLSLTKSIAAIRKHLSSNNYTAFAGYPFKN